MRHNLGDWLDTCSSVNLRGDGGLDQNGSSGGAEKWLDCGRIWNMERAGVADSSAKEWDWLEGLLWETALSVEPLTEIGPAEEPVGLWKVGGLLWDVLNFRCLTNIQEKIQSSGWILGLKFKGNVGVNGISFTAGILVEEPAKNTEKDRLVREDKNQCVYF